MLTSGDQGVEISSSAYARHSYADQKEWTKADEK